MNIDIFKLEYEYIFVLEGSDGYSFGTAAQQAVVTIDDDEYQSKTLMTFADGLIVYLEQDKVNKKVRVKSNQEIAPSEGTLPNP